MRITTFRAAIAASTIAASAMLPASAATNITENVTLTEDTDWTEFGTVTLATGVMLDLNGHSLIVSNITGGVIVDLSDDTDDQGVIASSDGSIYQRIQYVEAKQEGAGNASGKQAKIQYVDTEYSHGKDSKVDIRVQFTDVSDFNGSGYWHVYYGCRNSNNRSTDFAGWLQNGKIANGGCAGAGGNVNGSPAVDTSKVYDFHLDKSGDCYAYYDSTSYKFCTGNGTDGTPGTDYIFAINQTNSGGKFWPCRMKCFSCKVYTGTTLERDFIPVIGIRGSNEGKAGFWCTVTEKFYGNSGYGDLTPGPATFAEGEGNGGSVTFAVAENETLSLANVSLIYGNIKVVKAGAGTLSVPAKAYFTRGVDVSAGSLDLSGPVTVFSRKNLGGVAVASGAKVSIAATDGAKYGETFTLNGGTLELACSGTATPVTTYITNSVALNAGAKIRFDTSAFDSTEFLLSTDGFTLGTGVESALSCTELSAPLETMAEASGANGIHVLVLTEPVTAVWTGAANNNVFSDPGNWSCSNILGGALSGAVPDAKTEKLILGANADWTSTNLALAAGMSLDLAGHNLSAPAIIGSGTVTDSVGTEISGYERIAYLQSTGTQWIDLGYQHNENTIVDFHVQFTDLPANGGYYAYFGCRDAGVNATEKKKAFGGWLNTTSSKTYFRSSFSDGAANYTGLQVAKNTDYYLHFNKSGACTVTLADGTVHTIGSGNGQTGTLGQNDHLFGYRQRNTTSGNPWINNPFPAKLRVYYFKAYSGTTLIRDMVPVRRTSDGVLGMLDLAQGGFYSNSGTGTFTAGANVATVAGGELRIITAENATNSCTVTLTGGLKLVKDGAGTLVMEKASQAYFGGTEIAEGVLKSGAGLAKSCGVVGAWIVASASGTVDFNGNANMQAYRYDFADGAKALNTGAAISSGAFTFTSFYTPVSTGAFTTSLASGATLDLTEWNGSWPISNVTAPAGTAESPTAITVKVDMDAETFRDLAMSRDAETGKNNGKLLTFGGARPANVKFTPDSASAERCLLLEDENGDIILAFKPAFTIIVK